MRLSGDPAQILKRVSKSVANLYKAYLSEAGTGNAASAISSY